MQEERLLIIAAVAIAVTAAAWIVVPFLSSRHARRRERQ
jgi:uncharacterized membrane protein